MKRAFRKYTTCFSLLLASLLLPTIISICCGPTLYPDESRFALFRTGLDGQSGLAAFYYSEQLFADVPADHLSVDYNKNCKEWAAITEKNATESDIFKIQYRTPPQQFVDAYSSGNWQTFKGNSFVKWLLKKNNNPALQYMVLAKKAESTQFEDQDPWDTTLASKGMVIDSLADKAAQASLAATTTFFKERYAFQAMKMYHYSGGIDAENRQHIRTLYQKYLQHSQSIVSGWGCLFYALAQDKLTMRTRYLLQTFDQTEEKKKVCFQSVSAEDLNALEKEGPDKKTMVLIDVFKAMKNKGRGLQQVKAVAAQEPDSKYLPLLISREVNKLENWLWSPAMLNFYENYRPDKDENRMEERNYRVKVHAEDVEYLAAMTTYLDDLVHTTNINKVYNQLALTHLYNMSKAFDKAERVLATIPRQQNDRYETQRLIENVITTANYQDIRQPEVQQDIAKNLQSLILLNPVFVKQLDHRYLPWDFPAAQEQNDDLSELFMLLSRSFASKGDMVTAGLLYSKANVTANYYDSWVDTTASSYRSIAYFDRYATPHDIERLLAFKHQQKKTAFQQLIVPQPWANDDLYLDLQGTLLFRQKKYKEALAVFGKMNPRFWQTTYEYQTYLPHTPITHPGKLVPSEKPVATPFKVVSKKRIAQEMVDVLHSIETVSDNAGKAVLYYRLGNAYLNTSYYGKAWMMMSYGKSVNETSDWDMGNYKWASYTFYPNGKKYKDDYYLCRNAIAVFKKAYTLTSDRELKAKCLLVLSYIEGVVEYPDDKKHDDSHYLRLFVQGYHNTSAYKYAAVHCPDVTGFH